MPYLPNAVDTPLQGKRVLVKAGKFTHHGVVLGEDGVFKDVIFVGVTSTTAPLSEAFAERTKRNKYISIYHARSKDLTVIGD